MNNINASLAFVINVHQRLVLDLPLTPFNSWCRWVHDNNKLTLQEKWDRILSWHVVPQDYDNPSLFAADWQLAKLLSKLSFGGQPTEADKLVGYQKFLDAELLCGLHNEWVTTGTTPAFHALRHGSSKIVARVLGDVSDFFAYVENSQNKETKRVLERFFALPKGPDVEGRWRTGSYCADYPNVLPEFGPGISVGVRSSKLGGNTEKLLLGTVTADCAYLGNWISRLFHVPNAKLARGSVLTFVVKRVGEARTICYEPSMNMLIQKLIGRYLKHRLKVVLGIDLRDQTRNQSLARLGSLCDSYATEDMSSASDLWSYQFVLDQLPFPWFKLLDDCRSKEYYDPITNDWAEFNKFSTMGNGFTFELETLLFYAVAHAAVSVFEGVHLRKDELSVYGDDIIFPKKFSRTVEQALRLCGHRPNTEKSYHEGPFRESCGGDFFNGWNVTPVKIKEFDHENPRHYISLYNRLAAIHRGTGNNGSVSIRCERALVFIRDRLVRIAPRVSSGPDEFTVNSLGWKVNTPSDRWLTDGDTLNNVWSKDYQSIQPKWLCVERERKLTDYHAVPEAVPYLVQYGGISNLTVKEVVFVRNPTLVSSLAKRSSHRHNLNA